MEIVIREIAPSDAGAAAQLSAELGYAVGIATMTERIATVQSSEDRAAYVACVGGDVIGWIDVAIAHHLVSGAYGEVGGLVVATHHRSRGIGGKLIAQAEQWIANQGVRTVVVRSRTTREAAHRFYLREGYIQTKTSAVFSKQLE